MTTAFAEKDYFYIARIVLFKTMILAGTSLAAQPKVVQLYSGAAPGSETWTWAEKEGINPVNNTRFAYNVTTPSLTIFAPDSAVGNGSAVLLVPGGSLHVVMMEHEGFKTARELVKRGVTVFVLKYRVAQLKTENPWQEMMTKMRDTTAYARDVASIRELAISDVKEAIRYIHTHAGELLVDKSRIGVVGFSAGAVMTLNLLAESAFLPRPAFTGFIYGVYPPSLKGKLNDSLAPAFFAAATDDQLAPARNSVDLYSEWMQKKIPAELHLYAKGGHGLNGSHANTWVSRFADWMESMGLLKKE